MNENIEHLDHVASMLAHDTAEHRDAARKLPTLRQNSKDAERENVRIADALGIYTTYKSKLTLYWQES